MLYNKLFWLCFVINLGNVVLVYFGEIGKLVGIIVEFSYWLVMCWGVSVEFVFYFVVGKVVVDVGGEYWDIVFLVIDLVWEVILCFILFYIIIQGIVLVSVDLFCQSVVDMDCLVIIINVG